LGPAVGAGCSGVLAESSAASYWASRRAPPHACRVAAGGAVMAAFPPSPPQDFSDGLAWLSSLDIVTWLEPLLAVESANALAQWIVQSGATGEGGVQPHTLDDHMHEAVVQS
jgi:hypothetical protein